MLYGEICVDPRVENIINAIACQGLSESQVAKMAGLGQSKVHRMLKGTTRKIDLHAVGKLEEALGLDLPKKEKTAQNHAMAAADMVKIPLYNATAEGGPGAVNHQSSVESYLSFTREYARVQFGSTGNGLACLKAAGDSMSPYINAGDVLIVDVSDRCLTKDGAAYVLQIDETTVVKRLHRLSRDRVSIRSDNPHGWNRDCDLAEMDAEGIAISGRVVAVIKMA